MADKSNPPPHFDDEHPYYRQKPLNVEGPTQRIRPTIYSPVTRMTSHWFSAAGTKCGQFENTFLKCAYQGSRKQMQERCIKEMEDLQECLYQFKQVARFQAIQRERGKRNEYAEDPVRDIYWARHAI